MKRTEGNRKVHHLPEGQGVYPEKKGGKPVPEDRVGSLVPPFSRRRARQHNWGVNLGHPQARVDRVVRCLPIWK